MGVILGFLLFIGYVILVVVMRSFTTLFHELGHAIPSLLFTDEKVQVFIGTYGDRKKGISWTLGRLHIFFKFNVFNWNMGLCQHQGVPGLWKNMLIIFGGPIASLIMAIPLLLMVIFYPLSDIYIGIIMIFVLGAAVDFVVNINPFGRMVKLDDGSVIRTDGQQLKYILDRLSLPKSYFQLEEHYAAQSYNQLIAQAEEMTNQAGTPKPIYDLLILAYKQTSNIKKAISTYHKVNDVHELTYDDFHDVGRLYALANQSSEALKYYNHCIHRHHNDVRVLFDRAMAYKELGDYDKSKMDLDAAIYHNAKYLDAYKERAFVLIKLGRPDEAYADLNFVKEHDDSDPYLYYYFGLYYELVSMKDKALKFYEQAKEMGIDYHGIDYKIHLVSS